PLTPQFYTLSLHDALPISGGRFQPEWRRFRQTGNEAFPAKLKHCSHKRCGKTIAWFCEQSIHTTGRQTWQCLIELTSAVRACARSEEHTSELQSRVDLVCR